jgi:hypothetical protein
MPSDCYPMKNAPQGAFFMGRVAVSLTRLPWC